MSLAGIPINILMPTFAGGGAEAAMVRLSHHWAAQGRQVSFVVNSAEGPLRANLHPDVEVVDLGGGSTRRSFSPLRSWLAETQPQLLVSVLYHNVIVGALALRLASRRTAHIALLRNHTTTELAKVSALRRLVEAAALRAALRSADLVGCVSDSVAQDAMVFSGLGPDRVRVTYNPVPLPLPALGVELPGWPAGGNKVLVAVGRLEPQKDYPALLRAVALARRQTPIDLVILGEGRLRPELEGLSRELGIAEHVHLLGYVPRPDDYVSRADAFVLTSLYEGFPNVVAEALALGKTVIATDAPGGSAEILADGALGYLAPVGDVPTIAGQIVEALRAPFDPARLRARAEEFDTPVIADRYEALFVEALGKRAAR